MGNWQYVLCVPYRLRTRGLLVLTQLVILSILASRLRNMELDKNWITSPRAGSNTFDDHLHIKNPQYYGCRNVSVFPHHGAVFVFNGITWCTHKKTEAILSLNAHFLLCLIRVYYCRDSRVSQLQVSLFHACVIRQRIGLSQFMSVLLYFKTHLFAWTNAQRSVYSFRQRTR